MAHAVLCRRDRPAIVVDVGPPHVEHLAHALTGQQAQAEQGGQSGINGVEGVPKRAKLAGGQNAFTSTLGRRSLDVVTWVGFKQSLRNGPSEEAPCRRKDAVRQHRRAFRDIRDEQRNIAAGDGIRRTVSPSNDDFAFD